MCRPRPSSKGEFIDYLQVRGEVKAVRSVALTVPTTGGGDLQILELAKNGMTIKKGDVVVRFDPMTVAAHAERQALRVQTGRRGNRQDARAVPHSGAAGADGPDEGALRRPAGGARRRAARISPANGARAEGARARRMRRRGLTEAERKLKALRRHREGRAGQQDPEAGQGALRHGARRTSAWRPRDRGARGRRGGDHAELALVLSAARLQAGRPRVAGSNHRRSAGSVDAAGDGAARRGGTRPHAAGPARHRPRRRRARQGAGREDRRHQRARARRFFQLAAAAQLRHDRRSSTRWIRGCGRA